MVIWYFGHTEKHVHEAINAIKRINENACVFVCRVDVNVNAVPSGI